MNTNRLATLFTVFAALTITTACGKKNQVAQKRATPPAANNPAAPGGNQPTAPQPTPGSGYEYFTGTWTANCDANNQKWSVKINGDVLTYGGVDCTTNQKVPGGFTLKFKLDKAPAGSDFESYITYYNADGSEYFSETVTGTTEPLSLYFDGDDTTYFWGSY